MIEVQRIESNGWVIGTVGEYRFQARIFREHAADPAWEFADSMISKLWIPVGSLGTVNSVRNMGEWLQIDVHWDNGRSLMLSVALGSTGAVLSGGFVWLLVSASLI